MVLDQSILIYTFSYGFQKEKTNQMKIFTLQQTVPTNKPVWQLKVIIDINNTLPLNSTFFKKVVNRFTKRDFWQEFIDGFIVLGAEEEVKKIWNKNYFFFRKHRHLIYADISSPSGEEIDSNT